MIAILLRIIFLTYCFNQISCASSKDSKEIINSFRPGGQYVLLTFDDGPHANTARLLDILREKKARVTFFIKGSVLTDAKTNKDLLKRMLDERHDVESLGWDQDTFKESTSSAVRTEHISKTSAAIREYTGRDPIVIRSPNGLSTVDMNKAIYAEHGLKTILWSIDSRDWELSDVKAIVNHVMAHVKPGDIIVFHDGIQHTPDTVNYLIDELYEQGYELLTIREVMSFPDDSPK